MLHNIESDIPFDVSFLDFWETGYIPDMDVSCKIIKCLDFMTVFSIGLAIGMNQITSD